MTRLTFAAIADDDTGASDLAGMLAGQGLNTVLVIDLPAQEQLVEWSQGCEAMVMAEGTRMIDARQAYERTRAAIRLLAPLDPRMFEVKYCSTFDSTEKGNIGPTIDAALDELDERFTIVFPALPVNGRTTYMGYHFVHQQLLSDSPMRHHPVTPMMNPNLVDFLSRQTRRRVGLVSYPAVEAGADAVRRRFDELAADEVQIAVVDCLNDRHVETICEAAAGLRLITGGSAPGIGLPGVWRRVGLVSGKPGSVNVLPGERRAKACLFVAGSCSVATRAQNGWLTAQGVKTIHIEPRHLATGRINCGEVSAIAGEELRAGRHCLITTSASPEEVREAQEWARGEGMEADQLGVSIVSELAEITRAILKEHRVDGLVSAGGETSGALCRCLGLGALRVGQNIEPGVPLCFSLGEFQLPVVLKSGNFGSEDFYRRALESMNGSL